MMRTGIALLFCGSLRTVGAFSSREAASLAQRSMAASSSNATLHSQAIPSWRLNMLVDEPAMMNQPMAASAPIAAALPPGGQVLDFQSSPAQDAQRCPLLKLPTDFYFFSNGRQSGSWSVDNDVTLAKWNSAWDHPFILESVQTVYINSAIGGSLSLKGKIYTQEELKKLYGWEAANATQFPDGNYIAIIDCDGRLLFVVQQVPYIEGSLAPGHPLEIYGTDGRVLARTIMDQLIERIQFVDTNGYLLATAESPGINASITRANMSRAVGEGHPLPYGLHFELGGYENSSRLLETDYRWVISAAVQVRAIYASAPAQPKFPVWASALVWIAIVLGFCIVGCALNGIYRLVYPYSDFATRSKSQHPMYTLGQDLPPRQMQGAMY